MWQQLDLFPEEAEEETEQLQDLDYVFVRVPGGYRLEHSYYRTSELGQVVTAEQAMDMMSLCSTFNLYAVVTFNENLNLPRRVH